MGVRLDGQAAVLHQAGPLCAAGDRAVVRDEDERQAEFAPQFLEQRDDLVPGALVKVAGWLVGEQNGWTIGQAAGYRDALPLAAGQLGREMAEAMLQPDRPQQGDGTIFSLLRNLNGEQRH